MAEDERGVVVVKMPVVLRVQVIAWPAAERVFYDSSQPRLAICIWFPLPLVPCW